MNWAIIRVIALLVVGIILFIYPLYAPTIHENINTLISTFASLLIGSAIVDGIFQLKFQQEVKEQVDSFSNNLVSLEGNIATLQDTVAIASGAVESGLTAVYATREECLTKIKELLHEQLDHIQNNKPSKKIEIKILGISLGDFLCPHGSLQPIFREVLKHPEFKIELGIVKDGCNSAKFRAIREEYGKFYPKDIEGRKFIEIMRDKNVKEVYSRTKCHDELKTATDYVFDLILRHTIDRDKPAKDTLLEAELVAYVYRSNPMVFMFLLNDDMFIENYHLAGRGGEAPILRVAKYKRQSSAETSRLFQIFMGHFESVKSMSEIITKDYISNIFDKNHKLDESEVEFINEDDAASVEAVNQSV